MAASVSKHDLRRVLVWHHNAWAWQARTVRKWVVRFKWLLNHTSVQVWSHFEHIATQKHDKRDYNQAPSSNFKNLTTYCAIEVVSDDFMALRSTFFGIGFGKATATA